MIWRKIWDFHWHQKERPPLSCHHLTGLKCGVESIFIYLLYVFKALLTVSILLLWGSPQLKPLSPALKDILALGICIITRYASVCVLCLCCLNIVLSTHLFWKDKAGIIPYLSSSLQISCKDQNLLCVSMSLSTFQLSYPYSLLDIM